MLSLDMFVVVNNGSFKVFSRVDVSFSYGDGCEVNYEYSKFNRKWCKDRYVGVMSIFFGVSGWEDGVDKDEGFYDFSFKGSIFGVFMGNGVSFIIKWIVRVFYESFNKFYFIYGF